MTWNPKHKTKTRNNIIVEKTMFQTNTSVHNPDKRLEITARSWGARNSVCFALTRDITSLSLCVHVLSQQVKERTCKRSESEVLSIVSAKQNKEKK